MKLIKHSLVFIILGCLSSCDFYYKRQCKWYITPEPDHIVMTKKGQASLCVRHYEINKQKCMYVSTIELAEKMNGVPYRMVDIDVKEGTYPREIVNVTPCKPD